MVILIVEDDPSLCKTLGFVFRHEFNFKYICAKTIKEAFTLLDSFVVDVVLLDYLLNDDTADSIVVKVNDITNNKPKIILMTAVVNSESIAHRLGVSKLLRKPFSFEELQHILDIVH